MCNATLKINWTDDETLTVNTDENGTVIIPVREFGVGMKNVTATYDGDSNYMTSSITRTINVYSSSPRLTVSNLTTFYNSDDYIVVTLIDGQSNLPIEGANVAVVIDDTQNYTTDEDGSIKVPVKGLDPDNYIAFVYYKDEEFDVSAFAMCNLTINKLNTEVEVNAVTVKNKVVMTIKVNDTATGFIELVGEDKKICLTLENGVVTYSDTMAKGHYDFNMIYRGDVIFNENSTQATFDINVPVESKITATPTVTDSSTIIVITVESDSDNDEINGDKPTGDVTIEIDGKTYLVALNDGIATFENAFAPGEYSATIIYAGDESFMTSDTTASFTVEEHGKHDTTIIAVPIVQGTSISMMVFVTDDNTTDITNYMSGLVGGSGSSGDSGGLGSLISGIIGTVTGESDGLVGAIGGIIDAFTGSGGSDGLGGLL